MGKRLDSDSRLDRGILEGGSQGAFEGLVAGGFLALFISITVKRPASEMIAGASGLLLGGLVMALTALACRRAMRTTWRRLLLAGSGIATGLATIAPLVAESVGSGLRDLTSEAVGQLLVCGLGAGMVVGFVQAITGVPLSSVPRNHPLARLLILSGYMSALAALVMALTIASFAGARSDVPLALALVILSAVPLAALSGVVREGASSLIEMRKARLRDLTPLPAATPLQETSAAVSGEVTLASIASDRSSKLRLLESALVHARQAHALVALEPEHVPELSNERRRHLELAFTLGKLDDAIALQREGKLERFLEAELARLQGDPERALDLALSAMDDPLTNAVDRAHATCVLALSLAQLGRFEEARSHLATIRRGQSRHAPFLARFAASSIVRSIEQFEEKPSRRASARA